MRDVIVTLVILGITFCVPIAAFLLFVFVLIKAI